MEKALQYLKDILSKKFSGVITFTFYVHLGGIRSAKIKTKEKYKDGCKDGWYVEEKTL